MLLSNPDRQHRISWLQMQVVRVGVHTEMNFQGRSFRFQGPLYWVLNLRWTSPRCARARSPASALVSFSPRQLQLPAAADSSFNNNSGNNMSFSEMRTDGPRCWRVRPHGSNVSLIKGWLAAVVSSSLQTLSEGVSLIGGGSRCGISPCDWVPAQPGSRAPSASANLIASVRIYITICHIVIYLELLVLSLSVLHHVFMLLWPQKQCG